MKVNWILRIKNKSFWLTVVPALFLLVQAVLVPFGYNWDFGVLNQQVAAIINSAFGLLTILGIVTDPTTPGVSDSDRAMQYTKPGQF